MKIETKNKTIDIFPIRKVRINGTNTEDEFVRVASQDLIVDHDKIIGMDQQQTTRVLNHMRHSNTDLMGNGKEFYIVRGNNLIPVWHSLFRNL